MLVFSCIILIIVQKYTSFRSGFREKAVPKTQSKMRSSGQEGVAGWNSASFFLITTRDDPKNSGQISLSGCIFLFYLSHVFSHVFFHSNVAQYKNEYSILCLSIHIISILQYKYLYLYLYLNQQ